MAKDIYEENKELKRALYNIEKAILEFRLTQLDLPLEKVNVPSVFAETKAVPYTLTTCSCNDGEGCDTEKLKEQVADLTNKLNGANAEVEYLKKELDGYVNSDSFNSFEEKEPEPVVPEEEPAPVEEAEPREIEEPKKRRTRKERGGTVFTDFKNLELDNNDFEGNSIVYSKKDI